MDSPKNHRQTLPPPRPRRRSRTRRSTARCQAARRTIHRQPLRSARAGAQRSSSPDQRPLRPAGKSAGVPLRYEAASNRSVGQDRRAPGLTPLRQAWIAERKDVEAYAGRPLSSPATTAPARAPRRSSIFPACAASRCAPAPWPLRHPDALRPPAHDHPRWSLSPCAKG